MPETPEEKTTEEVQQSQGPQEPSPSIENVLDNNFQIPKSESNPVPPIVKYLKQKARDVSQTRPRSPMQAAFHPELQANTSVYLIWNCQRGPY